MSLKPKKSIVLEVQVKDFFHVEESLWYVLDVVSANRAGFLGQIAGGEAWRFWISKAGTYPGLDLLGGYP